MNYATQNGGQSTQTGLMESGRIGMIRRSLRAELVRLTGTGILGGSPELAVRCRYLLIDGIQ